MPTGGSLSANRTNSRHRRCTFHPSEPSAGRTCRVKRSSPSLADHCGGARCTSSLPSLCLRGGG
eukprot:scaffold182362_cov26-Tisochrysis_lutea.AAC.1